MRAAISPLAGCSWVASLGYILAMSPFRCCSGIAEVSWRGAWFDAQRVRASCHPPQRALHTSCRRHSVPDVLAVHVVSRTDHALRRRNHRSSGRGHPAHDITQHIGENGMNFIIWLIVGGLIG